MKTEKQITKQQNESKFQEEWEIEIERKIEKSYRKRTKELKSYKRLIKIIPASELKKQGRYSYILIKQFPSEDNDYTWKYIYDHHAQFNAGGVALGDKSYEVYSKKTILRNIDNEIEMMN